MGTDKDFNDNKELIAIAPTIAGRINFNNPPTGVEVCPSMVHGGPFPATTDSRFTAVGINGVKRWVRPVCYQNCPEYLLPAELKNKNPKKYSGLLTASITTEMLNKYQHDYHPYIKYMKYIFHCIDAHTCGNPVRLVAKGGPDLQGNNMSEKRQHFLKEFDWIRKGLMFEPRGHDMMSGSILYPPHDPANDVAVLFIETSGCLPMCGHGTIGTITIAIEEGLIDPEKFRASFAWKLLPD